MITVFHELGAIEFGLMIKLKVSYIIIVVSSLNHQRTTKKKTSRSIVKKSSPFSTLVVLAFERLRLILRRKRADLPAPVVVTPLLSFPFLSLQLAMVRVPAVSPELVAQFQLFGFGRFVLSRSTLSCKPGSVACPSSFTSFTISR